MSLIENPDLKDKAKAVLHCVERPENSEFFIDDITTAKEFKFDESKPPQKLLFLVFKSRHSFSDR